MPDCCDAQWIVVVVSPTHALLRASRRAAVRTHNYDGELQWYSTAIKTLSSRSRLNWNTRRSFFHVVGLAELQVLALNISLHTADLLTSHQFANSAKHVGQHNIWCQARHFLDDFFPQR